MCRSKSQDVKKMTMNSENNAPLVAYTYFQRKDSDTEEVCFVYILLL